MTAEEAALDLQTIAKTRRDEHQTSPPALNTLVTERETLSKLVMPTHEDGLPPIVDARSCAPGYAGRPGQLRSAMTSRRPLRTDAPVRWRARSRSPPTTTHSPPTQSR